MKVYVEAIQYFEGIASFCQWDSMPPSEWLLGLDIVHTFNNARQTSEAAA